MVFQAVPLSWSFVHHEPICGTSWNIDGFRNHEYTLQLPVLRLIYSGFQMLAIFFVLSVHVLSWLSGLPSGYPPLSPRLEVPCSRRRVQHSILGCILDCTARTISSSLVPRSNRLATCRWAVNPVSKVARKALHADRGKGRSRKILTSLSLRDPYVSSLDPYSRIKNCAYSKSE